MAETNVFSNVGLTEEEYEQIQTLLDEYMDEEGKVIDESIETIVKNIKKYIEKFEMVLTEPRKAKVLVIGNFLQFLSTILTDEFDVDIFFQVSD